MTSSAGLAKGVRIDVARQFRCAPGAAARRQVSGQLVEALLYLGRREKFEQQPGILLVARAAEYHQARASGEGGAGAIGAGHRRGHPGALLLGRQASLEFTDVPRTGDIEGVVAAPVLVPDVGK